MSRTEPHGIEVSSKLGSEDMTESDDLRAIKGDREQLQLSEQFWRSSAPSAAKFVTDLQVIAATTENWESNPLRLRLRALLILRRRFSELETRYLININAEKGHDYLRLILRPRMSKELTDGGKQRREGEQDYWDARVAEAVHLRRKAGESKEEAIAAVLEAHQAGGGLGITLHSPASIERRLKRASSNARKRGYLNSLAPASISDPTEPPVKVSEITKKGAPRKK